MICCYQVTKIFRSRYSRSPRVPLEASFFQFFDFLRIWDFHFLKLFIFLHSGRSRVTRVTVGRDIDQTNQSFRVCKVNLATLKVAINLSVSSAVVNPSFFAMSKRAGESFATSSSAKQKTVHCTAMIARKLATRMPTWTITDILAGAIHKTCGTHQNIIAGGGYSWLSWKQST